MNKEKLSAHVTLLATITLTIILLSMVVVLLVGLFDPTIDNTEIFKAITPVFQMVAGAFVGLVSGIKIGSKEE